MHSNSRLRKFFLFSNQDIYKSNNCRSDYLEIRDGYWHKSPILGKFCGSGKVNDLIKSTGSRMLLTYTTTFRQANMRGFAASYEGESSCKPGVHGFMNHVRDIVNFCS